MKIAIEQVGLTMNRAQAEVMIDVMDMAADAQDTSTPAGRMVTRELRELQGDLKLKLGNPKVEVLEHSVRIATLREIAIGVDVLQGWIADDEQPTSLTEAQADGLTAITAALQAMKL